jgi:hypothetical protein
MLTKDNFGYYRVKARGGESRQDSGWSNTVRFDKPAGIMPEAPQKPEEKKHIAPLPEFHLTLTTPPSAPVLRLVVESSMPRLSWTEMKGATEYVLEKSKTINFMIPEKEYAGKNISFCSIEIYGTADFGYYRVRAKYRQLGKFSEWSNIVKVDSDAILKAPTIDVQR